MVICGCGHCAGGQPESRAFKGVSFWRSWTALPVFLTIQTLRPGFVLCMISVCLGVYDYAESVHTTL
jgi:hypothetical protein